MNRNGSVQIQARGRQGFVPRLFYSVNLDCTIQRMPWRRSAAAQLVVYVVEYPRGKISYADSEGKTVYSELLGSQRGVVPGAPEP